MARRSRKQKILNQERHFALWARLVIAAAVIFALVCLMSPEFRGWMGIKVVEVVE